MKPLSYPSKPLTKSRHSRIIFSEAESKALVAFAKTNQTTVTPILSAIIQVRLALSYAKEWPISKDATHADIFPVNIRTALKDSRRVGMSLAIHGTIMNTGEALHSKTKNQVEENFKDIVLQLASEAAPGYHACKDPQFRADLSKNVHKLYSKWEESAGSGKYNRQEITSVFYSDGRQDVYFNKVKPISTSDLCFELVDYDLDVHYTEPVL